MTTTLDDDYTTDTVGYRYLLDSDDDNHLAWAVLLVVERIELLTRPDADTSGPVEPVDTSNVT